MIFLLNRGCMLLQVQHLSKSFGEKTLFHDISFRILAGQKIALVADNGAGKSTLLAILKGIMDYSEGTVSRQKGITVRFLDQDPQRPGEMSVRVFLYQYDDQVGILVDQYQTLAQNPDADHDVLHTLLGQIESVDGRGHQSRVDEMVKDRHLGPLLDQPLSTLSGGEAKRVGLAKVFLGKPDLLVLDEPTNHLDLMTIELLESQLTQTNITVLMVTHDRYFLERVCTHIYELTKQSIQTYDGNYSYYLTKKAERMLMADIAFHKLSQRYKAELERVRKSPRARESKSREREERFEKLHETLRETKSTRKETSMTLTLDLKERRLGDKIIKIHKLHKSFPLHQGVDGFLPPKENVDAPRKVIVQSFTHNFKNGERVGVIGPNGVGKSTFIDILAGDIEPDGGSIQRAPTVTIGYYRQQDCIPNLALSVIDYVRSKAEFATLSDGTKLSIPKMLERFLFSPAHQQTFLSALSGGEKKRLHLLLTLLPNPNFLLLDEPTNDFDLTTIAVLEEFLLSYRGCLVVISHDRFFMDKLVDHLFVFEGQGIVTDFWGNYTQYRDTSSYKKIIDSVSTSSDKLPDTGTKQSSLSENNFSITQGEDIPAFDYTHHRKMQLLSRQIATLEGRKEKINHQFHDTTLDHQAVKVLAKELKEVAIKIEALETEWFALAEIQELSKKR